MYAGCVRCCPLVSQKVHDTHLDHTVWTPSKSTLRWAYRGRKTLTVDSYWWASRVDNCHCCCCCCCYCLICHWSHSVSRTASLSHSQNKLSHSCLVFTHAPHLIIVFIEPIYSVLIFLRDWVKSLLSNLFTDFLQLSDSSFPLSVLTKILC